MDTWKEEMGHEPSMSVQVEFTKRKRGEIKSGSFFYRTRDWACLLEDCETSCSSAPRKRP
jgi:hypothetical protein